MTDHEILDSLASDKCAACGNRKRRKQSHCSRCYFKLPPEMRQALYNRFDSGYQEAFRASMEFLQPKEEQIEC